MSIPAMYLKISPANCVRPPAPAKLSLPGSAFASAISSRTLPAGTDGCTISTMGKVLTLVIGAKSSRPS